MSDGMEILQAIYTSETNITHLTAIDYGLNTVFLIAQWDLNV